MRRPASYLLGSAVLVLLIGALLQGAKPANALPTSITLASGVSTVTGPGTVVSGANGGYGVIPGATWITATGATGTADAFSVTFTLPVGYSNPQLSGSFFADNWATVWLNGVLINNTQPVGDVPANYGANGAPPTAFAASASFVTGTNTLTFQVFNGIAGNPTNTTAPPDSGNPEALDFLATVTYEPPPLFPEQVGCGTYVRGGEGSGYQTNPATYAYTILSPLGISGAGTLIDHHWVHSVGLTSPFVVFDMGAPVPAAFYIPSIDHGPIPEEAIEATLYGTNNLADAENTWAVGTVSTIYPAGPSNWTSDDYSTRWTFPGNVSYRYIGIRNGGPGALISDGDAEIDAVCAQGTRVTATKFYDANANGVRDTGETGIAGWQITADSSTSLTNAIGQAFFVLQAGAHVVSEGTPVQTNWFHTTPASVNITVPTTATSVSFGNVCVGAGGARSKGFWGNKNGEALINDDGGPGPELLLLSGLNLRTEAGAGFNPTTYAQFNTWLQAANSTNMAYMLSAQLAAMELNVEAVLVSGSALIYAPGATSANALGFATVSAVMAEAKTALLDGITLSGDPNRAIQEALKNALDNANNNLNFVQATACAFTFAAP